MKQKKKPRFINKFAASALVVLTVAAACAAVFLTHSNTSSAASAIFSFTGASNWKQGPTNQASMVLFHNTHDCFTSVDYRTGSVDANNEIQKVQKSLAQSGYTVTPGGVETLALQTQNGQQPYRLQQLSVTGKGNDGKLKAGQAFGFVQLSGGYVKIEAYCDTPGQLPATIPALQAIKFNQ